METYHKIQTLFKRHLDGPKKGKMIRGDWTTPELEYLAGNEWEFTEKVDGTNIRIGFNQIVDAGRAGEWGVLHEPVFGGRSDNAVIPTPLMQYLEETFTTERFEKAGFEWKPPAVTLFGEGYGPKIQGGGKYRADHSFVLFDVKIGDWWLSRENVNDIAERLGLDSVPTLGTGTLQDAIDIVSSGLTWDKNGRMRNWGGVDSNNKRVFAGLKSQWGDFEAEGLVCRPIVPLFDRKGNRIICKVKSVDFK